MSEINGALPDVEAAQERLKKAALSQNMNPVGAALSGYLNGLLCTARLSALTEVVLTPPNSSWTLQEALEAAFARTLNQMAENFERAAQGIQVAPASTPLIRTQ